MLFSPVKVLILQHFIALHSKEVHCEGCVVYHTAVILILSHYTTYVCITCLYLIIAYIYTSITGLAYTVCQLQDSHIYPLQYLHICPLHNLQICLLQDLHICPLQDSHICPLQDLHICPLQDLHVCPLQDSHICPLQDLHICPLQNLHVCLLQD